MGAYSRLGLIRGWALIRIKTVTASKKNRCESKPRKYGDKVNPLLTKVLRSRLLDIGVVLFLLASTSYW